jgi:glyoxylase-like metal-dependent hydrolase (beta-lactamase superfamily II)
MRVTWRDVGHIRVAALLDGEADLATSISEAFPDFPPDGLASYAERMPGLYGAGGAWHLFSRAWLVLHPGGVTLVDTGLGGPGAPTEAWYPEPGRLHDAIREAGAAPDQIDTVVLTHLHDDHVSGTVTGDDPPVPAFPRARYLIQRDDVDAQRQLASESDEDRELWEQTFEPLLAAGVVDQVDGHRDLGDGIELRHAPGHTPGHQIVRLSSKGRRLTIVADAFLHPAQLAHPDWPAGNDMHPARAAASRREILASLFSNPGTVISPTHFDAPFGTVAAGDDGLAAWHSVDAN